MAKGGWRRLGRRRFRYVDSRDAKITDDEQLERIAARCGLAVFGAFRAQDEPGDDEGQLALALVARSSDCLA